MSERSTSELHGCKNRGINGKRYFKYRSMEAVVYLKTIDIIVIIIIIIIMMMMMIMMRITIMMIMI